MAIHNSDHLIVIKKNYKISVFGFKDALLVLRKISKKARVIATFMAPQTGKQITTRHILANISRTKDRQGNLVS